MEEQKVYLVDNEIEWEKVDDTVSRKILGYDEKIMMVKVFFKREE